MTILLKINAARRLSGSEGRRAARFFFRATCYGLFLFACYGVKYWPVWPGTLVFLGLLALALAAHFAAESLN